MQLLRFIALTLLCLLLACPALADVTITLTFTGDMTLGGEDYLRENEDSFHQVYEREGPAYFLQNFADYFAEDDLTIANLEGVLTDNDELPRRDKGKGTESGGGYWFRGKTEYVRILTGASVEAVSLANNHSLDYGEQGLEDTVAALDDAGVAWFATRDANKSDTEKFLFYEKDGVRICIMGLYWEDYKQGDPDGMGAWMSEQIKDIKQNGKADAVICVFHGGQEYGRHRSKPQQLFTAMAMRSGADLVICHHAHVVMGMDVIGNRSAFYSLGNFCFGGNRQAYMISRKKVVQDAAPAHLVRAVLTFADDGTYKGQQMTIVPVQTTSYDRIPGTREQPNDFQPKFVTGRLAANVLYLMQTDMNYDLKDDVNWALKKLVMAREEELKQMEGTEGREEFTLPYLPAE